MMAATILPALTLKFLEQFPLPLGELDRHLDRYLDVEVTLGLRPEDRHSLTPQAELRAGLGPFRDCHLGAPTFQGWYLDDAAESGGGHRYRHPAKEVGAFVLEEAMRGDVQDDVEVTGRAAALAGLALAGEANARTVFHACRNVDLKGLLSMHASGTVTALAGRFDDLALAPAPGTGAFDGKEPLLHAHAASTLTGRAADRMRARLGAAATTAFAADPGRDANLRLLAVVGFVQGDIHVVAEVRPGRRAAAARTAHDVPEHLVEDIGKAGEVEAAGSATATACAINARMPETVIGRAHLRVLQDTVGLVDFLESLFGFRIARIPIRVIFHGQLAVSLLEFLFAGAPLDPQRLVVISFGHDLAVGFFRGRHGRAEPGSSAERDVPLIFNRWKRGRAALRLPRNSSGSPCTGLAAQKRTRGCLRQNKQDFGNILSTGLRAPST